MAQRERDCSCHKAVVDFVVLAAAGWLSNLTTAPNAPDEVGPVGVALPQVERTVKVVQVVWLATSLVD